VVARATSSGGALISSATARNIMLKASLKRLNSIAHRFSFSVIHSVDDVMQNGSNSRDSSLHYRVDPMQVFNFLRATTHLPHEPVCDRDVQAERDCDD
jgi:hypothetical protein